ncbi:MAG: hypothetical protein JWO99_316 [Candidatus Saccharibacteria bacterium]|nr:hypothetical protein [Candidatus Saccharibacteria bacterium]
MFQLHRPMRRAVLRRRLNSQHLRSLLGSRAMATRPPKRSSSASTLAPLVSTNVYRQVSRTRSRSASTRSSTTNGTARFRGTSRTPMTVPTCSRTTQGRPNRMPRHVRLRSDRHRSCRRRWVCTSTRFSMQPRLPHGRTQARRSSVQARTATRGLPR